MATLNNLGPFLKNQRKLAGHTQDEFARRSGLGLRVVRELEQGKSGPGNIRVRTVTPA